MYKIPKKLSDSLFCEIQFGVIYEKCQLPMFFNLKICDLHTQIYLKEAYGKFQQKFGMYSIPINLNIYT